MSEGPASMPLPAGRFPFSATLESRWREIRAEYDALAQTDFFPWYERAAYSQGWDLCGLFAAVHEERGRISPVAVRRCPATMEILSAIPGIQVASFSVLRPGCIVYPHSDRDTGCVRCHLGLRVPRGARLLVGDQEHEWYEGRCLFFDNRQRHGACNESQDPRAVLLLDVQRQVFGLDETEEGNGT